MAGRGVVREKKTARVHINGTKPSAPLSSDLAVSEIVQLSASEGAP
jgi:hypothetical protein